MDAKWFKMELERYPDGFDPNAPGDKDEEEDEVDEDDLVSMVYRWVGPDGIGRDYLAFAECLALCFGRGRGMTGASVEEMSFALKTRPLSNVNGLT